MKMIAKLGVAATALAGAYTGFIAFATHEIFNTKAIIPKLAGQSMADDNPYKNKSELDLIEDWFNEQEFETIKVGSKTGNLLTSYFLPAEENGEQTKKFVVCSHGYNSNGKGGFKYYTKYWHDKGFNVLICDHQGCGESEGKYYSFGYYESEDVLMWIYYLIDRFGDDIKMVLHGYSMGAGTIDLLVDRDDLPSNVKFIISDCGYTTVQDEFEYQLKCFNVPFAPVIGPVALCNKVYQGFDYRTVRPIDHIANSKVPVLFIHGAADDFVPTFMGIQLYNACPTEKELCIVPEALHAASYTKNKALYEEKVNGFIDKYI